MTFDTNINHKNYYVKEKEDTLEKIVEKVLPEVKEEPEIIEEPKVEKVKRKRKLRKRNLFKIK